MGNYYKVACDELKENIDPGDIDNLGIKRLSIDWFEHPFGAVVIFAMLTRWAGKDVRLVDDCGEDPGYFEYKNVTRHILEEYNKF